MFKFPSNPVSMGLITKADHTTAPVSLLSAAGAPAIAAGARMNWIEVEAMKDGSKTANTGKTYIGTVDMNISTLVGVIKVLGVSEQWKFNNERDGNVYDPAQLFFQVASDNDGVHVRGGTR
jgi:hypothetical protein